MALNHRLIESNGIRMHIAEEGEGPLVILCHGFPELWYSWRHQLAALAAAGFHAVAPDQRGYGQTDMPQAVESYHILELVGDIVGLVHALGEEKAVIVGHDWGAPVACHCALLRPDVFPSLVMLSVPFSPRSWSMTRPIEAMKKAAGDRQFYIVYFQEPGRIEKELEANVRETMLKALYSLSGDPPPEKRWRSTFGRDETFLDSCHLPDALPGWLTGEDLVVFVGEFERTGFRGGVNWYRNVDRNWELTSFLSGAKIQQPTMFIAGELDEVVARSRTAYEKLENALPNLKRKVLIPGAGHWVQQERPREVNDLLIDFLRNTAP